MRMPPDANLPPTFLTGANLPWVHYGIDFGGNAWRPDGGIGQPSERLETDAAFRQLAASGVQCVRWFLFCDGRAGICFTERGRPQGLDDFLIRDVETALDVAGRHGIQIIFVLLDFHWCANVRAMRGVQMGGRAHLLADRSHRAALLDLVFRPLLERCGQERAILAWDIINEPEWIRTLTSDQLYDFLGEAVSLVHANAMQPVTIGSAGTRWRTFYQGLGLDFYQVHWYDALTGQPPLETPVSALGFDRPVVLGEFPTLGSNRSMSAILDVAHAAGYAGAFYWSALADDRATDADAAIESTRLWLA